MRIVLDTNVLVSGLLSEAGAPGWIVDLALAGELRPYFDQRILGEYREVLERPQLGLRPETVAATLAALEKRGTVITAPPWPSPLPDPSDEPFLAVASAASASLVTGNLRHFPARVRSGVVVLSPRELLDVLRGRLRPG